MKNAVHGIFMMPKTAIKSLYLYLLLLTGYATAMSDNKFDWYSTECAPDKYPMEIIRGEFIYKGDNSKGLYIPSGGTLNGGWGHPLSSHVVGDKYKPLPDRLKITFFSYAEKQFYQGEFQLPYDKILALFQKGVMDNPAYPTYQAIMAGIAPGGTVSVWVIGSGDYTEVFFGKAEKVEINPSTAFRLPFKNKADADKYMQEGLEDELTKEEIAEIKKNGIPFDLWTRYRTTYNWAIKVKGGHSRDYVRIVYLNAESENVWKNFTVLDSSKQRGLPRHLSFEARIDEVETIYQITFDDMEIMKTFERLGKDGNHVLMEIYPAMPRSSIKIKVSNEKESIELNKYKSKDW